ncbi:MAG: arginase [Planctomycetota bacterium]|nr:arginase [Planctomycetota bacterium]
MNTVGLLGVPLDLGAGRRGTDMGPSALRLARLGTRLQEIGKTVQDHGYIAVAAPEMRQAGDPKLRFVGEIQRTCLRLRERVRAILKDGALPLVLGGDHSIAMGTVAGVAAHYAERNEEIGLLWVDAHADSNTPQTTPSGNVHGMPLAVLLGRGDRRLLDIGTRTPVVAPKRTVLFGVRSVDRGESRRLRDLGLSVYTMQDIDERGCGPCLREALHRLTDGTAGLHMSLDMDALDPEYAPGVGTPERGGLTYREAHLTCELVAESQKLLSIEVVEVNPILDERNMTANVAVELVQSALGKTII